MIVVNLSKNDGTELGRITIEHMGDGEFSIQFAVERGSAVGIHRRSIFNFPREEYNVLALLRQALETLEPDELRLDEESDGETSFSLKALMSGDI